MKKTSFLVKSINNIMEQQDMAKTIAKKLTSSKYYKMEFGNRELTADEHKALLHFDTIYKFNYDKIKTIIKFIKQGYTDWAEKWKIVKTLHSSDLAMQVLLYGNEEGSKRYKEINKKKTGHFDHSYEAQQRRGMIAAQKLAGSDIYSIRSFKFWIKKGMTEDEAKARVAEIQATNTLSRYVKTYGLELGTEKFNSRKIAWAAAMAEPIIGRKRSLGLWRYIERYGEDEGKLRYMVMREKRNRTSRIGKASNESVIVFQDIISLLEVNNIQYYMGVKGNKEWFIYDDKLLKPFFYDLTIPSLSIIAEYHGEAFHPNPKNTETWHLWRALYSKKTADEVFAVDQYKKILAETAGWKFYEIYSSDSENSARILLEQVKSAIRDYSSGSFSRNEMIAK